MGLTESVAAASAGSTMPSGPGPIVRPVSDPKGGPMVSRSEQEALELLMIEEADAWFEYLESIRGHSEVRYAEVEPWAWARLMQRLRAVKTRRAKLKPAAA